MKTLRVYINTLLIEALSLILEKEIKKKNTTRIVHLLLTGAYSLIFPFHEHRGNTRPWSPIVRLSVVLGRNFVNSSYQTLLC